MAARNLVLVVNYNQAQEIGAYLSEVLRFFPVDEVLVIDDGSNDGSAEIAEDMGFSLVRHGKNFGIGAAIRSGLQYALAHDFEGVLISSSNGKMVPGEFPKLLSHLDEGRFSYIQGSRFVEAGRSLNLPLFRALTIPLLSSFFTLIFRQKMTDITCGLRAYKVSLLKDPRIHLDQEWLNRYELEYYLHIKFLRELKLEMLEVPVTIKYSHLQPKRLSKIRPISGWWSMARPFLFLFLGIKK